MPESKPSLSGLEKANGWFEPAGMPLDKLNFAAEPRYAPVVGSIPSMVATAGSIIPAGPVAAVVGAPQVGHNPVFGNRKFAISVCPGTFWLPSARLRNSVR